NGETAYTQHASNAYGTAATAQTSSGGKAAATSTAYGSSTAGKTSSGDMYASHDGNVYKNTGSGWQTYNNGSWNNVQKPTTSSAQSNPNYSSAQQKAQQSYNQQHPSSGSTSGYHPSSGSSEMDQEAQDRARGAQQSDRYSQAQHSASSGGDRWG